MNAKKVQMPREVYTGPDVTKEVGDICNSLHLEGEALIVAGPHTFDVCGEQIIDSLTEKGFKSDVIKIKGASMESVKSVEDMIPDKGFVFGVGGGRVIDIAKLASTNKGVYFLSVPTTASHDGMASPMASIKVDDGSVSMKAQSPYAVIADSKIIMDSPFELMSAGCADLISNYTAIKDWQLAHRLKNERYSESAVALSEISAKFITDNAESIKPGLEKSARLVIKTLFCSGLAISIAGSSRPASGSEHLFSHALDKILDKPKLHGAQCGIGTILMMALYGGDWKFIRDSLKVIKSPVNAKELGVSEDVIIEALTTAHSIRPNRYTILGENGISEEAAYDLAHETEVI